MSREHSPLRVGIFGAGTVGRHVIGALQSKERAGQLSSRANRRLELSGIARRNWDADPALRHLYTHPDELIARSDVVIELMGGIRDALAVILAAISQKKNVVTANKAIIAQHFRHIIEEARRNEVQVLYSASVGGAMDVLPHVDTMARVERIKSIQAIINATSNVILTYMAQGMPYRDALRAAQVAGYAEADPSLDVNGDDAVFKLTILIARAFGLVVSPSDIAKEGITGITMDDLERARSTGMTVKHVAHAELVPDRDGRSVRAHVGLITVPAHSLLGATGGAQNVVILQGEHTRLAFFGQGAGGAATAETVLNDLVRAARTTEESGSPFEGHFRSGILVAD